ncbi:AAA family ATPase [Pseudoalteromonas luteoviolacea]|uniref:chromosome segregation SMC family protein n=1 Tax=Pseudoalteromonas luteoviolacea TaxID=43657 RepID=UPI001B3A5DC5|nr:AAA family ATPase [Pseudoalteromonas luteoviolacea]MBQ4880346.1 AAA family ATPase [Pseudoalteromonas luteoviolacea]MBQ4909427.1 AAA family ATPase [Pseudoalteromonas luteoviolacea]
MRLSHIKLAGFKSFVEPTKIPFPDQMTCVVGPNGCGKSNVIDAVRWVLGESSAKNLRGDAMTDVIFNGSTNRKAISQASVELMFDNTRGTLPGSLADRNQISIKRLVTRDGQSLYFLNGSKCRRRDITDIFLGTGLGPRSYSIIEQGMISRLIESKPHELRVFLEEAAGVSKYKERRRETQTRIKSTRENLERLLDMRKELQSQLDRLAQQAEAARKYKELKAKERTLKGQLAVLKWQDFNDKLQQKVQQIAKLDEKLQFLEQAHGGQNDVVASFEQQVTHLSDALNVLQQELHKTHTELTRAEQQKIHLAEKRVELGEAKVKLQSEQANAQALLSEQQTSCTAQHQKCEDAAERLALAEAELEERMALYEQNQQLNNDVEDTLNVLIEQETKVKEQHADSNVALQQAKQKQRHVEERHANLVIDSKTLSAQNSSELLSQESAKQQSLLKEMASLQSQAQKLTEQRQNSDKQVRQSQNIVQSAQQQLLQSTAERDTLISLLGEVEAAQQPSFLAQLKVQAGFADIVESALLGLNGLPLSEVPNSAGIWAHTQAPELHSVAQFIESGIYPSVLNHIKWLASSRSFTSDTHFILAIDDMGCVYGDNFKMPRAEGSASQLANYQKLDNLNTDLPNLQAAFDNAEKDKALCIAKHAELEAAIEHNKQAVHSVAQQVAANKSRLEVLELQQQGWQAQSDKLAEALTNIRQEMTSAQTLAQQCATSHQQVTEQLEGLQKELAEKKLLVEANKQKIQATLIGKTQAQEQVHLAKLALQQAQSDQQISATKTQHLKESMQQCVAALEANAEQLVQLEAPLLETQTQITTLLSTHQIQQQKLTDMEQEVAKAKTQLSEKQSSVQDAQANSLKLKEQKQQLQLQEQSLVVKAQAALEPLLELKQTLKGVLATLDDKLSAGVYQSQLTATVQKISILGAVNLAAIEEFDEALARKTYLDEQLNDLTAALETLENAIRKIDRETKTRFRATFDQVNRDLGELFPKVFGGGNAYLELTSDDLLESGVTIMARPPGKKNSTIHLLSGGEKALTALSLVFSIFRLNPAPFCMLDEVDAPLDDANVGRFCRLVEEMSQAVQFIYISHNKVAMEMAARLTGVTMSEPGVSRVVAVDIEQAVQMAHT